ncbi:MAG: acetyl-CoA carboxylase biotin carboxyl carrier protein [Candidatus Caenarcaniphilales bacterium]|nr:acetyl-CoA carboxylase biotin carboxyl carrier protein [Candidatus Caenarcaniphilales bacterium]
MTKTLEKDNTAKVTVPVDAINQLAEILKVQDLTEIEVELEDWGKIKVRKEASNLVVSSPVAASSNAAADPTASAPANSPAASENSNLFEVKSPMVGTFYAAPSPEADAFIKVGDKVKKGDTLCIVEAMKLMNELPADVSGTVKEICVSDAQAISFGEVLIKIEPDA